MIAGEPPFAAPTQQDSDKACQARVDAENAKGGVNGRKIELTVKDDKSHAGHWSGELLPNPAQLIASGWTRKRSMDALKAGTTITVTVAPARAGGMVVLIMRILNEKGEELLGGGPLPGAAPRPVP